MHIAGRGKTFVPSSLHERGVLPPLFEANYLCGAGMFARTAAIQALGGLDERYHRSQDYHLGIRAALRYCFHVVPCGPTFLYSQHDGRRGPRAERFAFQQSTRRWLKYDQMLFFELIDPLPLSAFREPTDQNAEADALAYVNRARAAASKHLPFRAVEALIDRCIRFPDLGPTRIESIRIRDLITMGSWYGLGSIADDKRFWMEVATLRQAGAAGRCIADLLFQSRPSIARRTFRRISARLRYGA